MITLSLPTLPPSANHMYKTVKNGGRVLTDEVQTFRREVWAALSDGGRPAVPAGPLVFRIRVRFPTRHRQDLDNRIKSSLDALAIALRFDDCRIVRIEAERLTDAGPARVDLTLEAWKP